jgi:cytochrome c peroxidase
VVYPKWAADRSFLGGGVGYDPATGKFADVGRAKVSGDEADTGAFKTPTLREIAGTGPSMHDGSLKTLEEVVEHYDKGGIRNPFLDQRMKPLGLTAREKADLVAFLRALSGEGWQHLTPPTAEELPR